MGTHRVELGDGPRDVPVVGVSRLQWRRLLTAHHDEDDFTVHLIAACTTLTPDEAREVWDESPVDVATGLQDACLAASMPRDLDWAERAIAADGRLAEELRFCQTAGMSHTVFLGWDPDDQDLAVAALRASRDHCPGCGVPSAAMGNPEAAHLESRTCLHCQARNAAQDSVPADLRAYTHLFVVPTGGA